MYEYGGTAIERGIKVIIAEPVAPPTYPGMLSALTTLPVLGVPVPGTQGAGVDSLLSIVQMPLAYRQPLLPWGELVPLMLRFLLCKYWH